MTVHVSGSLNKVGTQCVCWFHSQAIYHDGRSYSPKIIRIIYFSLTSLTKLLYRDARITTVSLRKASKRQSLLHMDRVRKDGRRSGVNDVVVDTVRDVLIKSRDIITCNAENFNRCTL
jgi:hypothetical protein